MKKLALTISIVLGLGLTTFAGHDGGLFKRGATAENANSREGSGIMTPGLPGHGSSENSDAPLGTGIAVFAGLGAAYLISKRRKED